MEALLKLAEIYEKLGIKNPTELDRIFTEIEKVGKEVFEFVSIITKTDTFGMDSDVFVKKFLAILTQRQDLVVSALVVSRKSTVWFMNEMYTRYSNPKEIVDYFVESDKCMQLLVFIITGELPKEQKEEVNLSMDDMANKLK